MSLQKDRIVTRVIVLTLLFSTLASASLLVYTFSIAAKESTQVPYVGMTITLLYNKTTDIGSAQVKDSSHTVIVYQSKTPDGLFQVYAHEELFTFDLLVNATTRQYVAGAEKGAYVGHLVPTDLSVGDIVMIYPRRNFTVLSVEDNFELEKGVYVNVFKLRYQQGWVNGNVNYNQTIIRYYDTKYGLLIEELDNDLSHNPGYNVIAHHFKVNLVDNDVDNDGDGLTDFKELFVTKTDPLIPDTDHDLWIDSNDLGPGNILLPNGLIVVLLAVASVVAFLGSRRLKPHP